MRNCLLALMMLGCAAGCGDNSKECGPGTIDEAGECVPAAVCGTGTALDPTTGVCVPDGSVVCSAGTRFDAMTGTCKLDPGACQAGTVLINNTCADPTAGLTIDVQEGPEPNGLGVVEASLAQAGNITLSPAGTPFVVHGTLAPWRDKNNDGALDPDVDTFLLTVSSPVLLRITADGVGGTTAGFVALAPVNAPGALATWRRFGIDSVGDTSKRQVYLPNAGTYRIAIADTRTLGEYLDTGSATSAATGDYFVSITDLGAPTTTTLPSGNSSTNGTVDSDALAFYTLPVGTGVNMATLSIPSPLVTASLVVVVNNALRALGEETAQPAKVNVSGGMAGDTSLIVVDHTVDVAPGAVPYNLSVSTSNL